MNKFYIVLLTIVVTLPNVLLSQESYEQWLKKEKKSYQQFLDKEDKAFAEFLEKEWKAYNTELGKPFYSKPKPKSIPVVKEREKPKPQEPEQVKPLKQMPIPKKKPRPKPIVKPVKKVQQITYEFFGAKAAVTYKKKTTFTLSTPLDNKKISEAFKGMAATTDKEFVKQLRLSQANFKVDDWGYINLVNSFSKEMFPKDNNKQMLFCWYLLLKSGHQVHHHLCRVIAIQKIQV